jgi:hypothetical protein
LCVGDACAREQVNASSEIEVNVMTDHRSFEGRIPEALASTGFPLEHEVAQAFRHANWTVITNRYYVDDVDGKARELDLIAYKVTSGAEIDVVTSVLISCKKDIDNSWAIMSRSRLATPDPNLDWDPVHHWTSNDLLQTFLQNSEWRKGYLEGDPNVYNEIFEMNRHAFAFQLISNKTCKPNNDKPIFQSLTDLLKAQDHELSILPERMRKNRIYVFNLLTIVDANLYEVSYDNVDCKAVPVDEFRHLARYIVRKRDRVARVNICNKNMLARLIKSYDGMSLYNKVFFDKAIVNAFASVKKIREVQTYFSKIITRRLKWEVTSSLSRANRKQDFSDIKIRYESDKDELILEIPIWEGSDIDILNSDEKLRDSTKKVLSDQLRYKDKFRFDSEDIPF